MGEIVIIHRDGGETKLQNKQATVKITRAEQRKQLLGEDTLNITIQSAQPIEISIGDRIEIFGSIYTINQLPTIQKTGTRIFEQTIVLEGTQYELIDVQFILPGNTMYDNLTGDLNDFIDVLIDNADRVYPGKWVKGVVPTETETKTLSFTERNCLEVLQTLCEEYSTEFEIAVNSSGVRTLHIKQVGVQFPFTFTYGRTGGLYQLTRQNVNNKNVVTRLYAYGGRNNLGNTYRNSRLCLPGKLKNDSYIEDATAVDLYGIKENTKVFDDIFPARYGSVTSLGAETFVFHDSSMDFDLNETDLDGNTMWLIDGVSAKVRFTTGNLAGYEFDVHSYDHTTKEIQIVPFTDESGYKFPSDTSSAFQIAIGDVYHFTDINLPATYITEAEAKLQTEANKYYIQYRQPQVQYSLAIHPRFLEKYAGAPETITNIFALGDQIHVIDPDIGVDKSLRITGFTRDALDPYRYTITLSEAAYNKTIINRIISDIEDITDIIELNNLADPFKARRNWMAAQELLNKIFDPEGYYYSEKIKPLSIETTMLQVGAKSQQFMLQNTRFEPNHNGDPNVINIIGGQLVHYTINETITTWNLAGGLISALTPAQSYFVYAKCEREGSAGTIIIDSAQIKVDQDPMFYHFIIGHLSSVITNPDGSNPARILSLTYGSTTINGRFIKTGRIESSGGGSTYFDLDEGVIGGNIRFLSDGIEKDVDTEISAAKDAAENAQADVNIAKSITDKFGTTIDGGLINTVTMLLREAGSTTETAGITGIQGENLDNPAFWAGGTYQQAIDNIAKAIIRHDGSVKFTDAEITGTIHATSGDIGGWTLGNYRIGKTQDPNQSATYDGLALYDDFIKFSNGAAAAFIGSNVLPASTGATAVGRFENKIYNPYGTNYGIFIDTENANRNVAITAKGDILSDGLVVGHKLTEMWPETDQILIIGYNSEVNDTIITRFTYTNSAVGLPSRYDIADKLGIGQTSSDKFKIKVTIICHASSTQKGKIYGRSTEVSAMNNSVYPYRTDNDGVIQQSGRDCSAGDVFEFMLVWDGTDYRAYTINFRTT